MTGNDIYMIVTNLLGFTDAAFDAHSDTALRERTLTAINQIGADLCGMSPINSLTDSVNLSSALSQALSYGVAMLLSLIDGDSEKNNFFTSLYNSKRAAAKSGSRSINDVLPKAVL